MKRGATFLWVMILFLMSSVVWADDLNQPTWRGLDRTTYQRWEFGNSMNPTGPEADFSNTQGVASLTVAGDFPYTAWLAENGSAGGVWRFEDYISVEIANFNEAYPLKEIWIQLTYSAEFGESPTVVTNPTASWVEEISKVALGDDYWHLTYSIGIEPNPSMETIYIQPRGCTMYLDELVIDTICIPEPATILLLGLGGLSLLRRRR